VIKRVVDLTLHQTPPAATHWTERSMAVAVGIAPSSVHKIWKAHGHSAGAADEEGPGR
jgi:hypothetical protein